MAIADKRELVSGTCIGVFGTYVVYGALKLPYVSDSGPGPGFFPLWIGIALTLLSLYLVFVSGFAAPTEAKSEGQSALALGRALGGWLGLMLAIAFLPWLGFGLSLALLTALLILALERRSPWTALSVAVGLAVGFHLIFVFALGLSLPSGPWGF
jgi:putative tricarboxylic transport membrane protein